MSAHVEREKCTGYKLCIFICPEPNVISFEKDAKKVVINTKRSKVCGLCIEVCKFEAIAIVQVK